MRESKKVYNHLGRLRQGSHAGAIYGSLGMKATFVSNVNMCQCADFRPRVLYSGVLVPLPARLQTCMHDYGFCHLIDGYAFDYKSLHMAFQRLAEIHWTPCDTDEPWC